MPTPYFSCNGISIFHGDYREIVPNIPISDSIVTDPPYGTGAWKRESSGAGGDCRAIMQREDWDEWDDLWLGVIHSETVGCFVPNSHIGDFKRLFLWIKNDPRPRFSGQPSYGFEPFVVRRGAVREIGGTDYIIASSPRLNRDSDATGHPHQKPISVMRWCVSLCSDEGQSVLDLFCGSGTTLCAAMSLGRTAVGIELIEEYCEMAAIRIESIRRYGIDSIDVTAVIPGQKSIFD